MSGRWYCTGDGTGEQVVARYHLGFTLLSYTGKTHRTLKTEYRNIKQKIDIRGQLIEAKKLAF